MHLVSGKIMIDCNRCSTRVEITAPAGEVECPRCHETLTYNTRKTKWEFGQLRRKARIANGEKLHCGPPSKYKFTPEMDQEMKLQYDGSGKTARRLAARFGFPKWAVQKRARVLGLARCTHRAWAPDEILYLKKNMHLLSIPRIAQALGRTETAVSLKSKRLKINKSREGFTARGLGRALGVDLRKITYWFGRGWLNGSRRQTRRGANGDYYYFAPEDVREFILRHPWKINFRLVEQLTLIEILTGETINDTAGHPGSIDQQQPTASAERRVS